MATREVRIAYYNIYMCIHAALSIEMDLHLFVVFFRLIDGDSCFKKETHVLKEADGKKFPRSYA